MICNSILLEFLWTEALKTVTRILNRVPSKSISKMPFELWTGRAHNLRYFKMWGCLERSKGHRFYCPNHTTRIVETRDAKFLENGEISKSGEKSIDLNEKLMDASNQESSIPLYTENTTIVPLDDVLDILVVDAPPHDQNPIPPISTKWLEVMNDELKSMQINDVWELAELPNGVKPVGYKWVYKTKLDQKGNIERYKAHLVAKGYTQEEGIDSNESFSRVSRNDSLRIVMALVDHYDLELHQMDVKTAFLNGDLHEDVYMTQP
ncbi:retrovirus-related pol polyprotein from transposon TNT 1-94 [Tanacetum coccineum]